jgi:peptide/nickel transport system ATP-binding protein
MYLGKIMELTDRDRLYQEPVNPYTHSLLSAVPVPDPHKEGRRERIILTGDLPSPVNPPSGCVFRTRCYKAQQKCKEEMPELLQVSPGHWSACHFPEQKQLI